MSEPASYPPDAARNETYHPDGAQPDSFDKPIFEALLMPYRSLGRTGFYILMGSLIGCWVFVGALFLSIGAWPIFGFFGLDVLLVYLAFRWNYYAARAREEISVSRFELNIRKYTASGKVIKHQFNPFWSRFKIKRKEEFGILSMNVESRGKSVSVGGFLNPDDRESFATAFSAALAEVRKR